MDIDKYNEFINNNHIDNDIKFNKNKIDINITSDKEQLLFIPINYSKSYTLLKNNNKEEEITKVFNNYIGITIHEGNNNITI